MTHQPEPANLSPPTSSTGPTTNPSRWYEDLRSRYRPTTVRVVLIAESPPAAGTDRRRYFYASDLTQHDNLFRSVALAAYGLDAAKLAAIPKTQVLERLQRDGFYLADAVDHPINRLPDADRRHAIRAGLPQLTNQCITLAPTAGVFVCSKPVFKVVSEPLARAGIRILNPTPAPFPLGNTRAEFVNIWHRYVPPFDSSFA